jgi:hypothetical protein
MALHRNIGQLFPHYKDPYYNSYRNSVGDINDPVLVNNYVEGFIRDAKTDAVIMNATIQMFYTPSGEAITDKLILDTGSYNAWIDVYDPKLVELRFTAKGYNDRSLLFSEAQVKPEIFMSPGTKSTYIWVALGVAGVLAYAADKKGKR